MSSKYAGKSSTSFHDTIHLWIAQNNRIRWATSLKDFSFLIGVDDQDSWIGLNELTSFRGWYLHLLVSAEQHLTFIWPLQKFVYLLEQEQLEPSNSPLGMVTITGYAFYTQQWRIDFAFLMLCLFLVFFAFLEGLSPPAPNFSNVKPFIFLLIRATAFIHSCSHSITFSLDLSVTFLCYRYPVLSCWEALTHPRNTRFPILLTKSTLYSCL